ncbi:MAG: acyl carrier protein [Chitinispirillales bacterium]|jgi:acyl carrier protein|nr:acyl carrier protein [Chitinispirillales bacterium]
MVSMEEIKTKIRRIILNIAEDMEIEEETVTDDAHLINDLGMDSMALLEILANIEKEFGVKIPESEFPMLVSVNASVAIVKKYI